MAITNEKVYSASRDALLQMIRVYVTDPKRNQKNSTRRWIYREDPDDTSQDFGGYPYIVVSHADVGDDFVTLDNYVRDNAIRFDIDVYAQFNDEEGRLDTISDGVFAAIMPQARQDLLATNGLFSPKILSSPPSIIQKSRNKIIVRSITVEFTTIIDGSSD